MGPRTQRDIGMGSRTQRALSHDALELVVPEFDQNRRAENMRRPSLPCLEDSLHAFLNVQVIQTRLRV